MKIINTFKITMYILYALMYIEQILQISILFLDTSRKTILNNELFRSMSEK